MKSPYTHQTETSFRKNSSIGRIAITLMTSTALFLPHISLAGELPTGANIQAGDVSVGVSGNVMTVTQGSDRSIVNWNAFSIGAGNTVNFVQPGASSAILNRVTGATPSTIAGAVTGNGQVVLVNPNGIAITPTGTVNIGGGFIASTLDITNEDFLKGSLNFAGDGASKSVSNEGVITIGRGGYAALLGGTVRNDGLIAAPMGRIGLGSGERVTLDLSGDGFMQVSLPTEEDQEGDGALIENGGTLSADGGTVVMKAATAREAARKAVNMSGVAEARTVSGKSGAIVIGGGDGGSVEVSGKVNVSAASGKGGKVAVSGKNVSLKGAKVNASGTTGGGSVKVTAATGDDGGTALIGTGTTVDATSASGTGGTVIVTGQLVWAESGSLINASGATGGTVLLGGDYQGGKTAANNFVSETVANATRTYLAEGAVIQADGTAGAGGKVVLWSDDTTIFAGAISARAAGTATGGLIETSGHNLLFGGNFGVSTASESGAAGMWLLDPYNMTISSAASNNASVNVGSNPWAISPVGSGANINNSTLASYLGSTNITILTAGAGSEAGNITVSSAVSWSSNTTLTLNADATTGGIFINADITSSGSNGGLSLIAGSGGINQAGGTAVTANTLRATASNGGSVSLTNAGNSIAVLGTSFADGSFAVASNRALTVTGPVTFGTSMSLTTTSGSLTVNGALSSSGTSADLNLTAATQLVLSKDITLTGANAQLSLAHGAGYTLVNGARISLPGASSTLTIGGENYTLIRNMTDLQNVSGSSNYALATDLDASSTASWNSGAGFAAIAGFSGTFTGLGHFIDSLMINRPSESVLGLFGLTSGTIRDLTLSNVSIIGNGTVGSAAARLSSGTLLNVHATGSVTGQDSLVGGLVGWSDQGTISLSSSHVTVSGAGEVGGLVGRNRAATITNSYATGSVTGTGSGIGGLLGTTVQGSTLVNVYASGLVTGGTNAGGLIGSVDATAITVTNGYWDTGTTGQANSAGGTGISTANAFTQSTYSGFDLTNDWVMFDGDTRPMLRNEYSSVITTPAALQLMALDLSASYSLGANISMASALLSGGIWGSSGFKPVGSNSSAFTGSFNGNGHTISGLVINRAGLNYVGLFGYTNGATISNVTLSGGSITANSNVGALIGYMNGGSVTSASASTSVSGESSGEVNSGGLIGTIDGGAVSSSSASGNVTGAGYQVGGLAGYLISGGTITQSYATGNVTGTNTAGNGYIGGLVGANGYSGNGGTISQSYATGTVTGSSGPIGGFVGHNEGTITDSYATGRVIGLGSAANIGGFVGVNFNNGIITNAYSTGYVSGSSQVGGFAGYNNNSASAITNAYWNTQTSGQSTGISGGSGGITARTTAELQGSLPTGFSSSIWGTGTNLYPYLSWAYSTTPIAISGIAYSDAGHTALAGSLITAVSGGASIGSAVTGANGYYYILANASALNAAGVLTYVETGNSTLNAAFSDAIGTNGVQNVSTYGNAIHLITNETGLLATQLKLASTRGSYTDTELSRLSNVTLTPLTTSGSGVYLNASAASYALDANLTADGILSLNSGGAFTINGDRSLSAGGNMTILDNLSWSSAAHTLTLNASGNISLAGISDGGTNGSLVLNSGGAMTASGAISLGTFDLQAGSWIQVAASLPGFSATNFRMANGSTFLRATGGNGSSGTPYQIADIYGLQGMASTSLRSLDFVLTTDLDASGTSLWNSGAGFLSIGTQTNSFAGSFDGQGHTISGFTIDSSGADAGLFGYIGAAGGVSNLTIANASISGTDYVGGIAGQNFGTISNVSVSGTVTATNTAAGGLAGYNAGTITGSFATANVTANEMAGGLTGQMAGEVSVLPIMPPEPFRPGATPAVSRVRYQAVPSPTSFQLEA
ncbi:GLUG motif-containing protein [Pannonibacter phragmitetus]|uniref:two-partner secretion domain-containing protein n=1 Tax=Pannonibacter phragmitetus TaxID=121719 RepID=UPI003D2EAD51